MSEALADEVRPLGIKVLIVEPGAFRTGLFAATHRQRGPIADYADTVGRHPPDGRGGRRQAARRPGQGGGRHHRGPRLARDPAAPPLGDDAVDAISGHLDSIRADLAAWEKVARDTRLDAGA